MRGRASRRAPPTGDVRSWAPKLKPGRGELFGYPHRMSSTATAKMACFPRPPPIVTSSRPRKFQIRASIATSASGLFGADSCVNAGVSHLSEVVPTLALNSLPSLPNLAAGPMYRTTAAGIIQQDEDPVGHMLILFDPILHTTFTAVPATEGFTFGEILGEVWPLAITRNPSDPLRLMLDHFGMLLGLCILAGHIETL